MNQPHTLIHVRKRLLEKLFPGRIALCCLFAVSPLALAEQSGDFTYIVSGNTATITKYTGAAGAVSIPATLNTTPVVAIGTEAFRQNISITSVIIPDSVTSIENEAFYNCLNLVNVMLPSGVTSISDSVFLSCSSLISVIIPSSVTSIGSRSFKGCYSLKSLTLPNNLTNIGEYAFAECSGLTSMSIPNCVTSVGKYAFALCGGLRSVSISNGMTSIDDYTFSSCISLTTVTIPGSIKRIGTSAFGACMLLSSVILPNGFTSIGDRAFQRCLSLSSLTLPKTVTSIGNYAFEFCSVLSRIDFTGDAPTTGIGIFSVGYRHITIYRSKWASGFDKLPWTEYNLDFNDPPVPWMSLEIGSGKLLGYSIYKTGTYTIAGSGTFGSTRDNLRFSFQILSGDGEITANLKTLEDTGSNSCVGLMIRDTLATNSKQIFVGLSGSGNYRWVQRTTKGGKSLTKNKASGPVPNTWLRLIRKGKVLQAYASANGVKWTVVNSVEMSLAMNCYIGLAVASGSESKLNTSQFSNVMLKP